MSRHAEGLLVDVWVVPGASRDEVVGVYGDVLKVRTTAPAENGKAKRRVAILVANAIGGSSASVVTGFSSRRKGVVVRDVDLATAMAAFGPHPAKGRQTG